MKIDGKATTNIGIGGTVAYTRGHHPPTIFLFCFVAVFMSKMEELAYNKLRLHALSTYLC
jgi:hypothetical protein